MATMAEADPFGAYRFNLAGMGNDVLGVEGAAVRDVMIRYRHGHSPPVAWDTEWVWEAADGGFLDEATPSPPPVGF